MNWFREMPEQLRFVKKQGNEILSFAPDFAELRIAVFRDFPYLYEGSMEYELEYIRTYASCEDAFVFAVYHGDQMVGATTCVPLKYETQAGYYTGPCWLLLLTFGCISSKGR